MRTERWAVSPVETNIIRKGQIFKIISWPKDNAFWTVKTDMAKGKYCLVEGCAHLKGRNWILANTREEARKISRTLKEEYLEIEI